MRKQAEEEGSHGPSRKRKSPGPRIGRLAFQFCLARGLPGLSFPIHEMEDPAFLSFNRCLVAGTFLSLQKRRELTIRPICRYHFKNQYSNAFTCEIKEK